jgi:hypothetical protein
MRRTTIALIRLARTDKIGGQPRKKKVMRVEKGPSEVIQSIEGSEHQSCTCLK